MSDLTPDAIAQRQFKSVFRGLDPDEVMAFLSVLATELAETKAERDRLSNQLADLGGRDLRNELDTVGVEVAAVLEAAREAAEAMRERAGADAQRWRTEAMSESEADRRSARSEAEQLRADAWTTATELLESVQAEVQRNRSAAEHQALRLVGDAEREAHRLVSTAKRDAEESARVSKMESERLVSEAQLRYDQILQTAQKQVEATQERARVLEMRRSELAAELEAVRVALSSAEGQLDVKREDLGLSPPTMPESVAEPAPEPESPAPAEMIEVNNPYGDSGVVRIVRPAGRREETSRQQEGDVTPGPEVRVVTAAEVSRRTAEAGGEIRTEPPETGRSADPSDPSEVHSSEVFAADILGHRIGEARLGGIDELDEIRIIPAAVLKEEAKASPGPEVAGESPSESDPESAKAVQPEPESPFGHNVKLVDPAPVLAGPAVEDDELNHDKLFDGVENLFARLRDPILTDESEQSDTPPGGATTEGDAPEPQRRGKRKAKENDEADVEPAVFASQPIPDLTPRSTGHPDPFDLRDRLLLPIANRSLRNLKRQLTDESNVALEEVRSKKKWTPDLERLKTRVRADLVVLAAESFGAGHTAAEEMLGERVTRPSTPRTDVVERFAADLAEAVVAALDEGHEAGQGPQQLGTSISRVFRAWRTDESERRVRSISFAAYHEGLATTLEIAGRPFAWVIAGKGCDKCRAAKEVGDKTLLPPLHPGCDCAVTLP